MQHPDGDPFANESASAGGGWLARLERNARAEHPELAAQLVAPDEQEDTSMRLNNEQPEDSTLTSDDGSDEEDDEDSASDRDESKGPNDQDDEGHKDEDDSEDDSDDDSDNDSVALDEDRPTQGADASAHKHGHTPAGADGQPVPEGSKDAKDAGPTDGSGEPKKQQRKRKKQRSPSPPRPPPKPQTTIRLDIRIPPVPPKGGLVVNIRELARDAGQLVENPEPEDEPASAQDSADEGKGKAKAKDKDNSAQPAPAPVAALSASTEAVLGRSSVANMLKPKKRKRRRVLDRDEGYDKDDPFVDDSELHLDLVKTCGVPEREGFFVHQGPLPLLQSGRRQRSSNKPAGEAGAPRKRIKPTTTTATGLTAPAASSSSHPRPPLPSTSAHAASADAPLPSNPNASAVVDLTGLDDDDSSVAAAPSPSSGAPKTTKSRKSASNGFKDAVATASPGGSASPAPRSDEPFKPLDPTIVQMIEEFKPLVAKESFVPKNKFPDALKEPLFQIGLAAVGTRDLEQSFFPTLTTILPYNKYTITKLVKRGIYARRVEMITELMEQHIGRLQDAVNERLPAMQEQYEADMAEFRVKHAEWAAQNPEAAAASARGEKPKEGEEGAESAAARSGEPQEPSKKFRFDDAMKQCLFEILTLDSELVRLQTEKIELEKGTEKAPTEQTARKKIYARLANFWPEGWMTSTLLSREWSMVKKKFGL